MLLSPARMHIPDGMLSLVVSLASWGITALVVAYALRRVGKDLGERQIPLMGVMAAFIFAAQMINFPVAAGTSGHLLGGTLAAILLGPWAGMLTMTSVIIVQGLLFQDGGLLVMGANVLNMGLLTVTVGYGLYRLAAGRRQGVLLLAAGVAAWISVVTGALATSLELWLSQTARLDLVVPAMVGVHALIGVGEALITIFALAFIMRTRPDLLQGGGQRQAGGYGWAVAGVLVALSVVLLAPLASTHPDGLERVAIDLGFFRPSHAQPVFRLLPNYTLPLLGKTSLSTILAGVFGTLVVAGITTLLGRSMRRKEPSVKPPSSRDCPDPQAR